MAKIEPFMGQEPVGQQQPTSWNRMPSGSTIWKALKIGFAVTVAFLFLSILFSIAGWVFEVAFVSSEKARKDYEELKRLDNERLEAEEEAKKKQAELPRWVVLDALETILPPAMYDDPNKENRWLQTFPGGISHQTSPQYGVELLKINTAFREGTLEFIPLEGIKGIWTGKAVRILNSIGSGYDEMRPRTKKVRLKSGHDVWYIATSTESRGVGMEEGNPDISCKYRINFTPSAQASSESTWPPGEVLTLEYHHPDGLTAEEPGPRLPLFIPDENGKPVEVWWSCRVVWDAPMEGYILDKANPITGEPSRVLVGSTKKWTGRPEMTGVLAARAAKVIVRDENGKEIHSIPFNNRKHTFSAEDMLGLNKKITGNERLYISCPKAATVSIAVFVRLRKMN